MIRKGCRRMNHSPLFYKLLEQWELNYITIETLRGRVELGKRKPSKGITEEEFFEITGEVY